MLFAGIDVGSLTAQAAVIEDGALRGAVSLPVRRHPVESASQALDRLAAQLGFKRDQLAGTVATGYGRDQIQEAGLADANVSEISCHGVGAHSVVPGLRTLIDIGGQDAKAIRVDDRGELQDFAMNDKCAAGTGRFLEVMARTLDVGLADLGPLARRARQPTPLSNRCSIFCETEALHFTQQGVPREDVAAGVCRAMAQRVAALVRRVGVEDAVSMSGGVAKNAAVRRELERILGVRLRACPVDPQVVGALGAALLAERAGGVR